MSEWCQRKDDDDDDDDVTHIVDGKKKGGRVSGLVGEKEAG
jgi:hypothetical protein